MKTISYTKYHRDEDYKKFESMFRNIFQKRFNIISKYAIKKGRVLDVGASTGTFLQIFKEKDWEVWGIEPSKSGDVAREGGIKIVKSFFEKAELPKNYFDLVIMNHTLEHMKDPVTVLKKVNSVLKKDGIVFIDVPNYGGLGSKLMGANWPYLLPAEHLHQFTEKDLKDFFEQTGFKILHAESRSGIFEYANPLREVLDSLVTMKKRFFTNLLTLPYAMIVTYVNMGDSVSVVGKKI